METNWNCYYFCCSTGEFRKYILKMFLYLRVMPRYNEYFLSRLIKQTGYQFVYTNKILEGAKKVTIKVKNASLVTSAQDLF